MLFLGRTRCMVLKGGIVARARLQNFEDTTDDKLLIPLRIIINLKLILEQLFNHHTRGNIIRNLAFNSAHNENVYGALRIRTHTSIIAGAEQRNRDLNSCA